MKAEMPGKVQTTTGDSSQEAEVRASSPSTSLGYQALPQAHVAFPSLPNDTLQTLGLIVNKGDSLDL